MRPLPSRGWGPWREEFYSLHSNPRLIAEDVEHRFGVWHNVWSHRVGSVVFRVSPALWRWWANRPTSKTRRTLQSFFPNLK